jgi:hypothetical protein
MHLNRVAALIVMGLIATTNAGCATGGFFDKVKVAVSAFANVTDATVDPKAIIVGANVALALQSTGKNYLRLRRCDGTNGPICRDPNVTPQIIEAVHQMRTVRNSAQTFVKTHPGQLGSQGAYDAMMAAIDAVRNLYATYNVINVTAGVK